MIDAQLEITDALGRRVAVIDKDLFQIGRRGTSDLPLVGLDVSRDHAEIARQGDQFTLRDRASRFGTFVNGEPIAERILRHGDRIQLGRSSSIELVFLTRDSQRSSAVPAGELRQVAALLEALRALTSGRVLDEVLALVLDSALEVTGAERGFIMLVEDEGTLEFKLARGPGRTTLTGRTFETSRKVPEEVFRTGQIQVFMDLADGEMADVHQRTISVGIRHILCAPLTLHRYADRPDAVAARKHIGVLYLDSRSKGALLSPATRTALETLAVEAALVIDNAQLYREALEHAHVQRELKIAAEIQHALLPPGHHAGTYFDAAARSMACRAIGGDFFDYFDMVEGAFGFALGDVSGKGPPAALLAAMIQGVFAAESRISGAPADTLGRVNQALIRRAIQARFATAFYGVLLHDGRLTYANAGHNPPVVVGQSGVRRLECGGLVLGLFGDTRYEQAVVELHPGDIVVVFSDGITDALNPQGEEFGDDRLIQCLSANADLAPAAVLETLMSAVREFAQGAVQNDDLTAMVVRYRG
jgi:serine phosphatase RsbU (regulator of sigma subunit)